MIFLFEIFKRKRCRIVALIAAALITLIVPKDIFKGWLILLGVPFIILSSMVVACVVRLLKERIDLSKESGASFLAILATVFGFIALHMCTLGSMVCGATLSFSVVAFILPEYLFHKMSQYPIYVLIFSILLQIISLYLMNCFKKSKHQK